MIVPMRKLSLLIFYRDYQAFLGELREKGVVHIHENKKRSAEDEELKHKFAVIKRIGERRLLRNYWNVGHRRWNRKKSCFFINKCFMREIG